VAPFKEDPMDFVLWKPSTGEEPGWESPWGRGRPGWHIECSAMAHELLGESFDIHGGGLDLQFPHHENEIAQSACAHPHGSFARYWLHNEMLQVEGKKMSKSLGNFFTVRDLLDQGVSGPVIRLVLLGTHYRKPMDWTEKKRQEALKTLQEWTAIASSYSHILKEEIGGMTQPAPSAVVEALADDLNTSLAIAVLRSEAKKALIGVGSSSALHALHERDARSFLSGLALLGIDLKEFQASAEYMSPGERLELSEAYDRSHLASLGKELADRRTAAVASKDFSAVDALKSALIAAGVEVRMSRSGVELVPGPDFDPAKLEALQ